MGERVVNILCYTLLINAVVRFVPTVLPHKLIPFKILIAEAAKSEVVGPHMAAGESIATLRLAVVVILI
jgi:hypothetical protein